LLLGSPHAGGSRIDLQRDLGGARQRGELHLLYQPIVAIGDGQVTGVEALLRWTHPVHGPIPPDVFIPLAEQSGLINDIGRWVLHQACGQARRWDRSGRDLSMSVNVSVHQLMSPAFADTIATVLRSTDINPSRLTLEITESVFVRHRARALAILGDLKQLGVMLALDDFGTGYSSLSYLRDFPIDTVKIDRTFIADLGLDSASDIIIGAIVTLAHELHLAVVAEGIETAHQYQGVAALGCDHCQGFYFAVPMSAADLDTMLGSSTDQRLLLPEN
jgi:EAL domain-containing protein (putative c-di-GMP-specific phosphodiesterase class I)